MPIIRSNAIRIKRFRELKQDLRTSRDRLLVGIDIAKAQHVAQVRLAHTRILDKQLGIPNTWDGFAAFWAHLQHRQTETGAAAIVCAVEPTGTSHEALAQFLEGHEVDVVLVSNHVAALNRRTLDGTWGKSDPKDAHNLCDLLERGHVLFSSRPDAPLAALRRLVRLLRHARTDLAACKARFRNTLLPALGPAGAPPPAARIAALPAPLQRLCPIPAAAGAPRRCRARGTPPEALHAPQAGLLPPALAFELTDLAARVPAVQARIAAIAAELVRIAGPLPASAWLRTIPGVGPTVAASLLAEVGDIAWDHQVQSTPEARGAGDHRGGVGAVDRDGAHLEVRPPAPPVGPLPGGVGGRPHPRVARAAGDDAGEAPGGPLRLLEGEYRGGREAPADRLGGVAEWATLRPGTGGGGARRAAGDRLPRGARRPPRAPPAGQGQAEIVDSRGSQAGRVSARQPVSRQTGTRGRA